MAIAAVIQGTVEFAGKVFEVDSPRGLMWLESVTSFRFEPTGANKPYTARKESGKGGDYWYGYRKVAGKLHKKYIGKNSELSTAKLEEIAEALNTPQQPRVTQVIDTVAQVTEVNSQRVTDTVTNAVTDAVTDRHTAERVTALELQIQALQKSLEELRSVLLGKSEGLGNSPELLNSTKVTDNGLHIELSNSGVETFVVPGAEELEFLKKENESLKQLLDKKSSLVTSDFYVELQKLRERNRQDRLEIGEKWRSSIVQISDLKRQLEGVTDSELQIEVGNLRTENETLRTDYAALLESSTDVTNKLRQEVQELRSQLETERASREEIEAEFAQFKKYSEATIIAQRERNLERGYGFKPTPTENILRRQLADLQAELSDLKQKFVTASELPEAADLLNQLKAKRKKSSATLADVEKILEILEEHENG